MVVKYISVLSDNATEDTEFFTSALGFEMTGEIEIWPNVHCRLVGLKDSGVYFAIIPRHDDLKDKSVIILNTDNCLYTFHKLKLSGVKFTAAPYYLPAGLFAEFEDSAGTRFILLEERVYEEN